MVRKKGKLTKCVKHRSTTFCSSCKRDHPAYLVILQDFITMSQDMFYACSKCLEKVKATLKDAHMDYWRRAHEMGLEVPEPQIEVKKAAEYLVPANTVYNFRYFHSKKEKRKR